MNKERLEQKSLDDDVYLQVWQTEQNYVGMRWNITAFFLGISFATFGFSFQLNLAWSASLAIRICGLLIYWFAYIMYCHYSDHTYALRRYLLEMETSGRTTIDIQSKVGKKRSNANMRRRSTTMFLLAFGVIYLSGTLLLWVLHL